MALYTGNETICLKEAINPVNSYDFFIGQLKNTLAGPNLYYSFTCGNVKKVEKNGRFILLWQDRKGRIGYSFNWLEDSDDTTTLTNLGNLLTNHIADGFGDVFEVLNNPNERLKHINSATISLNKTLSDAYKHNSHMEYLGTKQSNNQVVINATPNDVNPESLNNILSTTQQELQKYCEKEESQNNPILSKQAQLYNDIVAMSINHLDYKNNINCIYANELTIVRKKGIAPWQKKAFYYENGLLVKNEYIASEYMVFVLFKENIDESFIFKFIFYMAKKNFKKAMDIFVWLADSFNLLAKLPYILALHSKEDECMKLFYEEIVSSLLNAEFCETIVNENLDEKSLSKKLDKKVIYNFHNITTPMILNAQAKEFSRKLIYKDKYKLNNKNATTVANTLITSTNSYMPLIAENVPSVIVEVESNVKKFCREMNIPSDYYAVADAIERDLQNFSQVVRNIDMQRLHNIYSLEYYRSESMPDILDGDTDLLRVFETSLKNGDIDIFKLAIIDDETEALVEELEIDLDKGKVCKQRLLDYFTILFGKQYKNNRAFIEALRLNSKYKKEPFDAEQLSPIKGKVYYKL